MALIRMMLKVKDLKDNKQQQVYVGVATFMGKMMDWGSSNENNNNNNNNNKNTRNINNNNNYKTKTKQ